MKAVEIAGLSAVVAALASVVRALLIMITGNLMASASPVLFWTAAEPGDPLVSYLGPVVALRQKREPVVRVQVEKVERRDLTERVVANGRIQPMLQVKISAEVSGEIIDLPVKEGQAVKKGDLLVTIKPDVYVANRSSAEANYLAACRVGIGGGQPEEGGTGVSAQRGAVSEGKLISEVMYVEYQDLAGGGSGATWIRHTPGGGGAGSAGSGGGGTGEDHHYSPLEGTVSQLNSELGSGWWGRR
jgi:HlyD family secretion protein